MKIDAMHATRIRKGCMVQAQKRGQKYYGSQRERDEKWGSIVATLLAEARLRQLEQTRVDRVRKIGG